MRKKFLHFCSRPFPLIAARPRGELNVAKLGLVAAAVHAAARSTCKARTADILCVSARQNIIVICTALDERASRYKQVKEFTIRGQQYEVRVYVTTPHDNAKM